MNHIPAHPLLSVTTGLTVRKSLDCIRYYGGIIQGISTIFSAVKVIDIEEQNGSARIDEHLVSRINALNDATTELAKGFDREPTLEELSNYLALSEEEIRTLMKISKKCSVNICRAVISPFFSC